MKNAMFVLGAVDPEMRAIESLLRAQQVRFEYARVGGKRVYPANAYQAGLPEAARALLKAGGRVYAVECIDRLPAGVTRIDHHRPGDPGYSRPPAEYWAASSFGQTVAALGEACGASLRISAEMRMIAAADHCLGAAYQGECPGIDPAALIRWHITARARYEQRPETEVQADVEATRQTLRDCPRIELAPGIYAADVRGQPVAELLLAAARDGQCCLSAITARDGRTKIGCLVGSPVQVSAFMQSWAPTHHLVDIYGDSIRGYAGAYVP
ncbi:MAG: hypothetical protein ACRETQ_02900 [Gammaproteobacteria bacterium]